jgi:hypothetical protein
MVASLVMGGRPVRSVWGLLMAITLMSSLLIISSQLAGTFLLGRFPARRLAFEAGREESGKEYLLQERLGDLQGSVQVGFNSNASPRKTIFDEVR